MFCVHFKKDQKLNSLILASESPHRRQQLEQLGYEFEVRFPRIDETPRPLEEPSDLVHRLAVEKASKIAADFPNSVVIGSDQLGVLNNRVLAKPGTREEALRMLMKYPGNRVMFLTAVCLIAPEQSPIVHTIPTYITFRDFTLAEAERYLDLDQPLNCAGAFKSESRGALLFSSIMSSDHTAIVGLPLLETVRLLRDFGINPLQPK